MTAGMREGGMSELNVVSCIQPANAILGEGPVWDWRSNDLFWIDIRRMQVFRRNHTAGQTGQWVLPERLGCVALTRDPGQLLVTAGTKILLMNLSNGKTEELANPEPDRPTYRFNDGAVDAQGRLWLSTMMDDFHSPPRFSGGRLYRFEQGRPIALIADNYQLANGIGWSPDCRRMYINDTAAMITYAFDYDLDSGAASNRRALITHRIEGGLPDGLSVDEQGNIWIAMWDGYCLNKYTPDGALLQTVSMPVRRPSSMTFGAPQLDRLLITSATTGFESDDYRDSPLAGGLFSVRVNTTGRRAHLFGTSQSQLGKR